MKKLKHPESKHIVETRDEYADMYRSQGWVEVKTKKAAPAKAQKAILRDLADEFDAKGK